MKKSGKGWRIDRRGGQQEGGEINKQKTVGGGIQTATKKMKYRVNYENRFFLYGKFGDMKDFSMMTPQGIPTDSFKECSVVENEEYVHQALMEAVAENKDLHPVFQLRTTFQDVVYQTPS